MGNKVSVVICTYNRADLLKEALQSLIHQTADPSCYEVIIVDNNSTDKTVEVVHNLIREKEFFRYVLEPKQGLSHARNRGYVEAAYDWVAYVDDDAKVFPNYVERIQHVIDNYKFDCFGGVYLPWYNNIKPKWYRDEYQTNVHVQTKTGELPANKFFSGGNCVFRKDLLKQSDGFNVEIGMTGNVTAYGEETLLINKLRQLNYKIGFDPELKVEHYVAIYKLNVKWFFKSAYAHGRDGWKIFKVEATWFRVVKSLGNMLLLPITLFPNKFLRVFSREYYFQNFFIDTFTPSAAAWGQFVEGVRLLLKNNSCFL